MVFGLADVDLDKANFFEFAIFLFDVALFMLLWTLLVYTAPGSLVSVYIVWKDSFSFSCFICCVETNYFTVRERQKCFVNLSVD